MAYTAPMGSAVQISITEYLETAYRPDREYLDGAVMERNMGKWSHARVQALLSGWFLRHEAEWNLMISTEQRLQVSPSRVRVPDLVVLEAGVQPEILEEPPLLVIEVLSADDSYSSIEERCQDYVAMGVQTIWIVDPKTRTGRMCVGDRWVQADRLEVSATPIYVELTQIFARMQAPSSL